MDCLRDDGRKLSLDLCFTGWSSSWLVGAVVMILGAMPRRDGQFFSISMTVDGFSYAVRRALEGHLDPPWCMTLRVEDRRHGVAS
jgi:hypothetical protein